MKQLSIPTGATFGRWTVLDCAGKDKFGNTKVTCKCVCGYQGVARLARIKADLGGTCTGNHATRSTPAGVSMMRAIYRRYKNSANERGYAFDLTQSQFQGLTSESCFYCGMPPNRTYQTPDSPTAYTYNGIDRMDNTRGYVLDNCVPCCWQCNKLKSTMPYAEFTAWLDRIAQNWTR